MWLRINGVLCLVCFQCVDQDKSEVCLHGTWPPQDHQEFLLDHKGV